MKYFITMVFFVIACLSSSLAQIPTDSLIAYYTFNDNALDVSGHGHNGITLDISPTADRFGNPDMAYNFNGTTSEINIGNLGPINDQTVSIWFKKAIPIGYPPIYWEEKDLIGTQNDSNQCFRVGFHSWFRDEIWTEISDKGVKPNNDYVSVRSNVTVIDTFWHHLVIIRQGNQIIEYLDSVQLNSIVNNMEGNPDGPIITNQSTKIGRTGGINNNDQFAGSIDDVRIYNRVLSENEIQALYHETDLIAYYPFNGNADDESGNGHDGVNDGATLTADRFVNLNHAYRFDGYDNINIGNLGPINDQTTSLWFKKTVQNGYPGSNPSEHHLFGTKNDSNHTFTLSFHSWVQDEIFTMVSDKGMGSDNDFIDFRSNTKILDTSWHHLVVTRYADTIKQYLDGNILPSSVYWKQGNPTGAIITNSDTRIGYMVDIPQNAAFQGSIDDIYVYNRILDETEIKSLYGNYRQQIISITDIPHDQGGKVRITWDKIYLDTTGANPRVTSYGVWRKIPTELLGKRTPFRAPFSIADDTLGVRYDYLGTVNAVQSPSYNYVAQTLADSDVTGPHDETYLITAHTADPNVYYISDPAMGHSVDNLAPSAVTALQVVCPAAPLVQLSWFPNVKDSDLKMYNVYRSTESNFVPSLSGSIGSTTETSYQDNTVTEGYKYYYKVCCVDYHDNLSSSDEVSAGYPAIKSVSLIGGWNMVSVPLNLDDFSKAAIFPSAISDAYEYNGAYKSSDPLEMGKGYWVKFSSAETRSLSGYLIGDVAVDVNEGWNMIGSVSEVINVANIISDPPAIKSSEFFIYDGSSYRTSDVIAPGSGYWVKVNASGKLTLSTSNKSSANRINLVPIAEMPPQPPADIESTTGLIPAQYVIEQNYPNPFNPTTMIRYALPSSSHVTLSVFNTLGEQVALLVSGQQDAGYHEVTFNAEHLSSGVYFYRLQAGDFADTKKLLLMK